MSTLTFAQSYILASKVRSKLTKEAANPKSSLRNLVIQANMLDNLMDYITEETEKRSKTSTVKFDVSKPRTINTTTSRQASTLVKEIELDEDDSDEDVDDDDYDEVSSSDDDYYYYSDEEEPEEELKALATEVVISNSSSYKQLPYINLSLSNIPEEDQEDQDYTYQSHEVPELSHSRSLSESEESEDSESDEEHPHFLLEPRFNLDSKKSKQHQQQQPSQVSIFTFNHPTSHQRTPAIYSIESVF
ncbi:hypothetical protein DFJ63DRAFT_333885 [Scheffersomyces coipomensis]|uniref:uncharacterized protein n=1 Tax=Scheffersomyces coipomensis TaxID=1788519 RepID=UPI00315CF8AC